MKKFLKIVTVSALLFGLFWLGGVMSDRITLSEDIIRLHVVANSDSEDDQAVKLKVRDAITERLNSIMDQLPTAKEARAYILEHMEELEALANKVLQEYGSLDKARITLTEECFDTRDYDTFSLPAGVYQSLRVTIGDGAGKNWWCVVFPGLCGGDFAATAAGSGFGNDLTGALVGNRQYEIRFYFLDLLGRMQNFFHRK